VKLAWLGVIAAVVMATAGCGSASEMRTTMYRVGSSGVYIIYRLPAGTTPSVPAVDTLTSRARGKSLCTLTSPDGKFHLEVSSTTFWHKDGDRLCAAARRRLGSKVVFRWVH
jgi:hypothetical protein